MAKQINTRIQLKHDTLAAWNSSTIQLKYGEAAVAFVDTATTDTHGNIIHVPTALLKFGDSTGTKTFKDLPFASAIAADVYKWAKENQIYVEDTGTGEVVSDIEWQVTDTHPNGALVITRTDVVTPEELAKALEDYYTKSEIDDLIADANSYADQAEADAIAAAKEYTDTEINKITTGAGYATTKYVDDAVAAHETAVDAKFENYSTTEQMNAAIDADVAVVNSALETYKTSNDEALAGVKATADAAAVKTEVETALADRYTKAEADAAFDAKGDAAQALTDAKGYTDTQIQAIMGGDVDEAYNSFLEIQNFLKADETATAQLVEKVNANTAAAEAAQATADAALPTTTAEADYLKKADAAITYEPIGAQSRAEATAKKYTDDEIAKLGEVYDTKGAAAEAQAAAIADAAEKYETKGTAQGIIDGLNLPETYEPIGAETRAIAAAKEETENQIAALGIGDYAKTADVEATYRRKDVAITSDDLSDEVFIFNCGTASTVI